jgi:hypothetical protein
VKVLNTHIEVIHSKQLYYTVFHHDKGFSMSYGAVY